MYVILEACLLAVSLSIDAFAASFAYGCKKIKIPVTSMQVINLICCAMVGISFLLGGLIRQHVPIQIAVGFSFAILFIIGITKLFDSITKSIIRKHTNLSKKFKFSIFNFKLLLHIYADPEAADVDISESLSLKEAVLLAVSLSFDGIAVGLGAAIIGVNGWAVTLFSLITGFIALKFGSWLGDKVADKLPFNVSWLGGLVLIVLAIEKLL